MIEIKLPSKTFLIGEYLALIGLPCVLITTPPYFIFTAEKSAESETKGIPNHSPADLFIKQHADFFNQFKIKFVDPHQGAGGFGASSAQFLAVYLLKNLGGSHASLANLENNKQFISTLLDCYQGLAWNQQGLPPSGADIISQLMGDITYFDKNKLQLEKFSWPFQQYSYLLIHTNKKIATHQHLSEIDKTKLLNLPDLAADIKKSLLQQDGSAFIKLIKQFSLALNQQGLVVEHTQQLLNKINNLPGVLVSKGCGALGADVIFVLCDDPTAVRQWCLENNLKIVYEHADVNAP